MEYINKEQNLELNRLLLEHKAAMEALNSDRNAARKNRLETGTGTYSRKLVYCKPDEKLGKYILLIFDNIMLRSNYRGYDGELRVDITDNAMIRMQTALHRYDPDKGTGFNFLTMVLTQSIRSTLSEYNSKKDEEDKVEHVTLTTFSDETVHIPIFDDEIEVNSDFHNQHMKKDKKVDDDPIFQHMLQNLYTYKLRAAKDSIPLEEILKSVYAKRKRVQDIVVEPTLDAKERARLSALKYYYSHKEQAATRRKAWAEANPIKVREYEITKNKIKTEARRKAKADMKNNDLNTTIKFTSSLGIGDTND
jgi:hypothetical protein